MKLENISLRKEHPCATNIFNHLQFFSHNFTFFPILARHISWSRWLILTPDIKLYGTKIPQKVGHQGSRICSLLRDSLLVFEIYNIWGGLGVKSKLPLYFDISKVASRHEILKELCTWNKSATKHKRDVDMAVLKHCWEDMTMILQTKNTLQAYFLVIHLIGQEYPRERTNGQGTWGNRSLFEK